MLSVRRMPSFSSRELLKRNERLLPVILHILPLARANSVLGPYWNFYQFVKKAEEIHGDKYDYSKVDYDGTDTEFLSASRQPCAAR